MTAPAPDRADAVGDLLASVIERLEREAAERDRLAADDAA